MTRSKLIGTLALAWVFSTSSAMAHEGAYFAFTLGQSQTETNGSRFSGIGYSALLGAQLNRHLAVEVEYVNYGEMNDEMNDKISATSKVVSLIFLQPINQRTEIYAKLGAAQVNSIMSGTSITGISNTLSSMPYGLGIQYDFSRTTTLRLFAESGYNYQVNGTSGVVAATNYNFSGGIYRIGVASLYAF